MPRLAPVPMLPIHPFEEMDGCGHVGDPVTVCGEPFEAGYMKALVRSE